MRIGIGYDVHKLIEGRKLILGGVEIEYKRGLLGHSDADVLIHAIIDSILGAMSLGDIGKHFPDTDDKYKGISSIKLLKEITVILKENRYKINNIDSIIVAQKPKLSPYIEQMRINIAQALNIAVEDVNVKATTTEELGFEGREEGISAQAVCTLVEMN